MSLSAELAEISSDLIMDLERVDRAMEVLTETEAMAFIKALVTAIGIGAEQVAAMIGDEDNEIGTLASCWTYGFLIGREHGRRGYRFTEDC